MTQLVTVPKSEWSPFFNRLSRALLGKWAEIEVASLDLGDQVIAEWIPMIGITYEEGNDLLDVSLDRMNHLILHPREVLAEEGSTGLTEHLRDRRGWCEANREAERTAHAPALTRAWAGEAIRERWRGCTKLKVSVAQSDVHIYGGGLLV